MGWSDAFTSFLIKQKLKFGCKERTKVGKSAKLGRNGEGKMPNSPFYDPKSSDFAATLKCFPVNLCPNEDSTVPSLVLFHWPVEAEGGRNFTLVPTPQMPAVKHLTPKCCLAYCLSWKTEFESPK